MHFSHDLLCHSNKTQDTEILDEIQHYSLKKVSVGPAPPAMTASPNLSNLLSFLNAAGFTPGILVRVNTAACLTVICGVSIGGSPRRQGLVVFTVLLTPSPLTAKVITAGLIFPFLVVNAGEVPRYSWSPENDCGGWPLLVPGGSLSLGGLL